MRRKTFGLPAMSSINLSISHASINANSPLNQHETHIHTECEIYINLSGNVSFVVENRIYPISRGSVIITRPYEYHHCIYNSNEQHEHFWITFSAEESEDFLKMFFCREKGNDNLIILDEVQLNSLCAVLDSLLKNKSDTFEQRIDCLQFFRILNAGKIESHTGNMEISESDVIKALCFMDEHLIENFDIKSLSDACNVSVNTLERHFKKALGVTPFAMLRKKRLIASTAHLRNRETVTEAALKSGFSDYSNYIQLFRKQFAVTPLQYKKKFEMK